MGCNVCGGVMQTIGFKADFSGEIHVAWCPRCGSWKDDNGRDDAPALAERTATACKCFFQDKPGTAKHDKFVRIMCQLAESTGVEPTFRHDS